jgi:hypothetical protein
VLATGYADTEDTAGSQMISTMLRKPFQVDDLSRAVRTALKPALAGTG